MSTMGKYSRSATRAERTAAMALAPAASTSPRFNLVGGAGLGIRFASDRAGLGAGEGSGFDHFAMSGLEIAQKAPVCGLG